MEQVALHWSAVLSPRESAAVRCLLSGQRNKEAAHALGISEHTMKHHVTAAMAKSGASDRLGLALWAIKNGGLEDVANAAPKEVPAQ